MQKSFSELPLKEAFQENLTSLGFEEMTAVQAESLPAMLDGQDVIVQAKTGSGKTVAFGLSLLSHLDVKRFRVQALVLCPTRELAMQVAKEVRRLARCIHNVKVLTLCGGMPLGPQFGSLEHGAHIVIGTPGRLLLHLRRGSLSLKDLHSFVLDEADRMLDMGFEEELQEIVKKCPTKRQTLLFSATYPDDIRELSQSYQKNPLEVTVEEQEQKELITQRLFWVDSVEEKVSFLTKALLSEQPESCLIFCERKIETDGLARALQEEGFSALAIHGDLEQKERNEILVRFANKSCSILVATDVAARGWDISGLELVVNTNLPREPEVYVHRIGRTGRAGNEGKAFSFVTKKEKGRLKQIERFVGKKVPLGDIGEFTSQGVPFVPEMVTLCLDAGKKKKLRPGDILGALTKEAGLPGKKIGKIDILAHTSYVAVHKSIAKEALKQFQQGKVKGRHIRARRL